jgi:16S rRNA (guanine527-N7)-methyltransferase
MVAKKDAVEKFLKKHFPEDVSRLMEMFTKYYAWLLEENQKINLISRKTDPETIWTHHFLDSLLSVGCVDYRKKTVLDFGTGGGFPGIPLAVIYTDSRFFLLDSTKKKIASVKAGASVLGLGNCEFLDMRLEEVPQKYNGIFDIIVCRSVRIIPEYKKLLLRLLKKNGQIVLYKSQNLDDAGLFENVEICDVSRELIGERKIVVIKQ